MATDTEKKPEPELPGPAVSWNSMLGLDPLIDPKFVPYERVHTAALLNEARAQGFTEFIVVGIAPHESGNTQGYYARVFSRPRPAYMLDHILDTAKKHIMLTCLGKGGH